MKRHNERDFVIPALKTLYHLDGTAKMKDIKDGIRKYVRLNNEDYVQFDSRSISNEARYKQVVGNLVSHRNKEFFKYVSYDPETMLYTLKEEGFAYVEALEKPVKKKAVAL